MVEWTSLQWECHELKKKEEPWNEAKHAYQKALIEYKHKNEGLKRNKEPWLQELETINQTIEKMTI